MNPTAAHHVDDRHGTLHLLFTGLSRPVTLDGCASLLPELSLHCAAWPFSVTTHNALAPCLRITRRGKGYILQREGSGSELAYATETRLLGDLGIDLMETAASETADLLLLHCAAVELHGSLAVFPNVNHAGKSLLAASLLARGKQLFADDLLGLTPKGTGRAFGLPPRLRMPLPELPADVGIFIATHTGISDDRYLNMAGSAPEIAPYGEERPLGVFILLDRKAGRRATLLPVSSTLCLQHVLYQHQMRNTAAVLFERAKELTDTVPGFLLRYDSVDEALALLEKPFLSIPCASMSTEQSAIEPGMLLPREVRRETAHMGKKVRRNVPGKRAYRQGRGVIMKREGDEAFLIREMPEVILYLNPTARALWELMAAPLSEMEAVTLLAEVFPHIPRRILERDVMSLFSALQEKDLVEPAY